MAKSIGLNIKSRRIAAGFTQEDLAIKMGLTQANISRIEASVKGPSAEVLMSISDALSCDVRELLGQETNGSGGKEMDKSTKAFFIKVIKSEPQFGVCLRKILKEADNFSDEDFKFLGMNLKLSLNYASKVIKSKQLNTVS